MVEIEDKIIDSMNQEESSIPVEKPVSTYSKWDTGKLLKKNIIDTDWGGYAATNYYQRGDQYYQVDNTSRDMQLAFAKSDFDWGQWVSKEDSTGFHQGRIKEITLEDWKAISNASKKQNGI